jgi:hypothetical protein
MVRAVFRMASTTSAPPTLSAVAKFATFSEAAFSAAIADR